MLITYTDTKTFEFPALNTAYTTISGSQSPVIDYEPGSGAHVVLKLDSEPLRTTAEDRIRQLALAAKGARHWSNDEMYKDCWPKHTNSGIVAPPVQPLLPTYAGQIFHGRDAAFVLRDATWAENRAQFYASFGIEYVGATYSDPRYAILLDHKGKGSLVNAAARPDVAKLVEAMPEKWWPQCALISSGNIDKLGEFLNYMSDLVILTYSDSGEAKLKHLGVPYARIAAPNDDPRYGDSVRAEGERLSYRLSFE